MRVILLILSAAILIPIGLMALALWCGFAVIFLIKERSDRYLYLRALQGLGSKNNGAL